jgi:hypothetical protein
MTAPDPTHRHAVPSAPAADGRDDFDFLLGTWQVRNQRLQHPLDPHDDSWEEFGSDAVVRPVLHGLGNTDTIASREGPGGRPFEGLTLRLFDPGDRTWRIWWTSTRQFGRLDPPMTGTFTGGHGVFFGEDEVDGIPIRIRFDWHALDHDRARWIQAFSLDGGHTWTTNWIMDFTRASASG